MDLVLIAKISLEILGDAVGDETFRPASVEPPREPIKRTFHPTEEWVQLITPLVRAADLRLDTEAFYGKYRVPIEVVEAVLRQRPFSATEAELGAIAILTATAETTPETTEKILTAAAS
jgi:hypothetical protein